MTLKSIIEAILFAAGRPVTVGEILAILEAAPERIPGRRSEIEEALEEIQREWEGRGGAVRLERIAEGYELRTGSDAAPWIRLLQPGKKQRFTTPSVETLALIAYRQPITRSEIEGIRGVDSAGVLKGLLERNLVRVVGRKEEAGRPLLYATSREFLELFSLKDLNDLPPISELEEKIRQTSQVPAGLVPTELDLSDLRATPLDLSNLEAGDREILGDLEKKLGHLKAVEKEIRAIESPDPALPDPALPEPALPEPALSAALDKGVGTS